MTAEPYDIVPRVRVSESRSVGEDLELHSALDFLHGHLVTSKRTKCGEFMSLQTTPHSSSEGTWPSLPTSCEVARARLRFTSAREFGIGMTDIAFICFAWDLMVMSQHLIQPSTYWNITFGFLALTYSGRALIHVFYNPSATEGYLSWGYLSKKLEFFTPYQYR